MAMKFGSVTTFITGSGAVLGRCSALGALYRERDAQARSPHVDCVCAERSTLESQARSMRLKLLHASRSSPHFLFNTLANVQALVRSGIAAAPRRCSQLIAYLARRDAASAVERTDARREPALVRAYLELMQMRMPDRLTTASTSRPHLAEVRFRRWPADLIENAVRHGIDPSEVGGSIVGLRAIASRPTAGSMSASSTAARHWRQRAVPGPASPTCAIACTAFFGAMAHLDLMEQTAAWRARGDRVQPMRRPAPMSAAASALIADDEPLLRERLRAHLARLWPELQVVGEARNGREAVELFGSAPAAGRLPRRADARHERRRGGPLDRSTCRGPSFVTAHEQYAVQARSRRARSTTSSSRSTPSAWPTTVRRLQERLARPHGVERGALDSRARRSGRRS
jgi:hypothetical protein